MRSAGWRDSGVGELHENFLDLRSNVYRASVLQNKEQGTTWLNPFTNGRKICPRSLRGKLRHDLHIARNERNSL